MLNTAQGTPTDATLVITSPAGSSLYRTTGKRLFDVVFVLVTLPILVPLVALLAGLVRLDGGNPFFAQGRVGRDGREFRCWKIRTMVPDAELRLAEILSRDPDARTIWEKTQKLVNDPRTTRVGRFLRKTSLDELPQFFNVLRGEMSVVGPRPFLPNQRRTYERAGGGHSYYALRPGVTGLWQVGSRNKSLFIDRIGFDDAYAEGMSFIGDLLVIVATVWVVLRPTGA